MKNALLQEKVAVVSCSVFSFGTITDVIVNFE
jgi:hypothetical protein